MPCNTDYMEPTVKERQTAEVAKLLVYVYEKTGQTISKTLRSSAESIYGMGDLEIYVEKLCKAITDMSNHGRDAVVYNARDKMSRKLADWWEEHQAEDEKRREIEMGVLKTADGAHKHLTAAIYNSKNDDDVLRIFAGHVGAYFDMDDSTHIFELSDGVVIYSGMNGLEVWKGKKL